MTMTMMIKQKPLRMTPAPSMTTLIRCGYFVRKCRFSSTAAGDDGGYVISCDAADGTDNNMYIDTQEEDLMRNSDIFQPQLELACHSVVVPDDALHNCSR